MGATATISFQVQVGATIPTPNPISNTGTVGYNYVVDPSIPTTATIGGINTNASVTTINHANVQNPLKAVDIHFSNVPATLTYTVTLVNTGNTTATNMFFYDTIPTGTSFIPGSLLINGVTNPGNPNPPGVTLPDLGPGSLTTVTFKVLVTSIPTPNPILNAASNTYQYTIDPVITPGSGSGNTNIVSTLINQATLQGIIKSVNNANATCGDIVTYTITVPNTGNTTANNIIIIDTIPNGLVYVPNTLQVNGSPTAGTPASINIGNIAPGAVTTIVYQMLINC